MKSTLLRSPHTHPHGRTLLAECAAPWPLRFAVEQLVPASLLAAVPLHADDAFDAVDPEPAEAVAAVDPRPTEPAAELSEPVFLLDGLPEWIQTNLRGQSTFRAAIHRAAVGAHLTSIEPGVAVITATGEPVHLCHWCDDQPGRDGLGECWAPDSTITILTVTGV